jgi:hypothetical protein
MDLKSICRNLFNYICIDFQILELRRNFIVVLFIFTPSLLLNSQIDKNKVKFDKPISTLDSFNRFVDILYADSYYFKDSLEVYVTSFIINPEWVRKNKKIKLKLSSSERNELIKTCQIQYDWHHNRYSKEIENLFIQINERDQRERVPMTDCFLRSNNEDSCKKLNNWESNKIISDSINWKIIDSIILRYGFPKSEWMGRKGYNGFMTSYFSHNKEHILQYFDIWMKAGKRGYIATKNLEDSYSLNHCLEQKHNTIFCKDQNTGKSIPCTPCVFKPKCCE